MPDVPAIPLAISSAVVSVLPGRLDSVATTLSELFGVEVRAATGSKIVIVLEAPRGETGKQLVEIALLDGVVSANMVFEHIEEI
ncbi:chaperone NapD [Stappia sp. WLB 29]|uniref:chaperone NapD n=1 Tax=Stappia sp. WLB 29 TaxID=2925220 RepID=UPI0020C01AC8|nr:chaperone NapD [Stappia sp. WLB 29]